MSIQSKTKTLARCRAELEKIEQSEHTLQRDFAVTPKRLEKQASRKGCLTKAQRGMHARRVARRNQLAQSKVRVLAKIRRLESELGRSVGVMAT